MQGQANDERGALAAHLEARFCTFGRGGSCHGWFAAGVHFRFLTEIGTRGVAWRAAVPCGCAGAAISRQRNARPPDSMLILPYRPSHTHTLLRAGTMCPLCGSSWKKRLSYRTTQSSLTVRSLSSRKIRSSSAATVPYGDNPPAALRTARNAGCVPANTPAPDTRWLLRDCGSPSVLIFLPSGPGVYRAGVRHVPWLAGNSRLSTS